MKNRLLFLFLFVSILNTKGQDPYAVHIDKTKGLPSNSIYQIYQDVRGFIWLASNQGLCRYDGFEFKSYVNKFQTSKAGSEIQEDKYGRIWYENFDGFLYYVEKDSLKKLEQNTPSGFLNYGITNTSIFCIQKNGVDIFNLKTLKLVKTINFYSAIAGASKLIGNDLYILGDNLYKINESGKIDTIQRPILPPERQPILMQSIDNKLFLLSRIDQKRNCYFVDDNKIVSKFPVPNIEYIQSISVADGKFWFCTPIGVYIYNKDGSVANKGKPILKGQNITGVLKDREGNFWFCSATAGLFLITDINSQLFKSDFIPTKIVTDNQRIFIGSKNEELYSFDLNNLTFKQLHTGPSQPEVINMLWDSLSQKIFYSSRGFKTFDKQGKSNLTWDASLKDVINIGNNCFAFASSGMAGIFSFNKSNLSEWNKVSIKGNTTLQNFNFSSIINGVRAKSVAYHKKNNTIFFATNLGLYAVNTKKINELKYKNESIFISKFQQFSDSIYAIDAFGTLYNINNLEVSRSFLNEKFINQAIVDIKVQEKYLFILTEKMLSYYDISNGRIYKITTNTPLGEIFDFLIFKNKLVLASNSGLIFTDFQKTKKALMPKLIINNFWVNEKIQALNSENIYDHTQNNIKINYSILAFKPESKTNLYYRINKRNWELTSPEIRTLNLIALEPGTYNIEFSFDADESKAQTLSFTIKKPLWLRTWFIILVLLLIAASIYGYFKWEMKNLKQRNKLETEKFELEKNLNHSILTSIRSQMNPHFFYNALNTIQSYIYSGDKKIASSYLSKFSKLTRTILEMSEKETVSLEDELSALNLYLELEKARFENDFEYEIKILSKIDLETTQIPSMLIQPYIENAIKHGLLHKKEIKRLNIAFALEGNILKVEIDDNGIGRKKADELSKIKESKHKSFSSNANQKRLEILNSGKENKTAVKYTDKTDDYGNPSGTLVEIHIPINKNEQ